jgi:enamine deaminase RidA (YjgF/YER057c/UK114 family)
MADVVRIRVFVADQADYARIAPVIGRHCRVARPANTTVVTPLVEPSMKVEIEVTARRRRAE